MGIPSFPPSGKVVSLMEVLELMGLEVVCLVIYNQMLLTGGRTLVGTNGESLLRVSENRFIVHDMGDQPFRTARRYFISRMCSYVGRSVGPTASSTSVLRRSNTSGWIERRNTMNVSVEAVCKTRSVPRSRTGRGRRTVSRPARRTLKISSRKTFLSEAFQLDGP